MSRHPEEPMETQDKLHAIKSALRQQQEEYQREEMRERIEHKIQHASQVQNEPEGSSSKKTSHKKNSKSSNNKKRKSVQPAKRHTKKSGKSKKTKKKTKKRGLNLFPRQGDSPFEVIRKCIFLMSSTIFMVCMFLIGQYFWDNYQNAQLLQSIEMEYNPDRVEPTEETLPQEEAHEYYGLLPTVSTLLEKNSEVVGFISIPDTVIQYPVLQHRIAEDGNEYYLNKNILLQTEKAGSIFLDYRNYFDLVENGQKLFENSCNLIIYGHNMHDYSMFGSLKRYINEADYYDQHPIVYLNSNYRKYQYKIFGMIIVDVDDESDTKFDYWNTLNFADETDFYNYVNEVKRRTVRLTDVDVTYGDQLLTLSTCNSTFSDGRLVVFARLLREGEDLTEGCTSTPNPNIKWPNSYYKWRKNTYDPNAEFIPYG